MSQSKWITLKTTTDIYHLHIIKGKLSEHEIDAVIINKIDSSYLQFGEAELKIKEADKERAQKIIENAQ
ncbi:MAG: putative signal transducing protein [Flavobacteriales bacterium]